MRFLLSNHVHDLGLDSCTRTRSHSSSQYLCNMRNRPCSVGVLDDPVPTVDQLPIVLCLLVRVTKVKDHMDLGHLGVVG